MFNGVDLRKSEALRPICYSDDQEKHRMLTLEEEEQRNLAREDYKYWSLFKGSVIETEVQINLETLRGPPTVFLKVLEA